MPSTVILGTGIIGLSTAYYLSLLAESDPDTTPTADNPYTSAQPSSHAADTKHEIHLVEPSPELFASASGKAAGFLARDWFAPAVAPLGELSFDLHRKLAEEHGGRERWGWCESVSYSLDREDDLEETDEAGVEDEDTSDAADDDEAAAAPDAISRSRRQSRHRVLNDLDWLMTSSSRATLLSEASEASAAAARSADVNEDPNAAPNVGDEEDFPRWVRAKRSAMQAISDRATTGQVDPYRLCQFLLQECISRGVKLHHPARATQLVELPADSSASPRTSVRLQYLDPDPEAMVTTASTPNSKSPPSDALKTSANGESASNAASGSTSRRRSHTGDEMQEDDYLSYGSNDPYESSDGTKTLDVPCDSLVIAAGCWTPRVYRTLFPNAGRIPRVTALAGHSVTFKSRKWMRAKTKRPVQHPKPGDTAGDALLAARPVHQLQQGDSDQSIDSVSTGGSAALGRASPAPSFSRTSSTISTPLTSPGPSHASLPASPKAPLPDACHAIFTSDRAGYSPEIFSRLSGDIWLGGLNSAAIPLPVLPTMATPDPEAVKTLLATAEAVLGHVAPSPSSASSSQAAPAKDDPAHAHHRPQLTLLRSTLCFRPVAPTGRPVIARMHEADLGDGVRVPGGVFVATAHGPWGISQSLGTGKVVSEMVLGRETSADVRVLGTWEAGTS